MTLKLTLMTGFVVQALKDHHVRKNPSVSKVSVWGRLIQRKHNTQRAVIKSWHIYRWSSGAPASWPRGTSSTSSPAPASTAWPGPRWPPGWPRGRPAGTGSCGSSLACSGACCAGDGSGCRWPRAWPHRWAPALWFSRPSGGYSQTGTWAGSSGPETL